MFVVCLLAYLLLLGFLRYSIAMSIVANSQEIKALSLDLDGTILSPETLLTEQTVRAIQACRDRGLRIIINTGRSVEGAEAFRAELGIEGAMVYCNGALTAQMPDARVLRTALLDKAAAALCVELAREAGVYCQVFFPDGANAAQMMLMAEQDAPEREMYYHHTRRRAEMCDLIQTLVQPEQKGCFKLMFITESDILTPLREKIQARLGASVYVTQTYSTFLEVMDAKASKGQGLEAALKYYSLKRGEVLAIGDEENDLPMFAAAGFSAAPANAKDSVKAAADVVIGSNADDGVAAFLEEIFAL